MVSIGKANLSIQYIHLDQVVTPIVLLITLDPGRRAFHSLFHIGLLHVPLDNLLLHLEQLLLSWWLCGITNLTIQQYLWLAAIHNDV